MPTTTMRLLAAAAVLACGGAQSAPEEPAAVPAIVGTWDFVRACGGIMYTCRTDSSEPTRYVFRPDHMVEIYRPSLQTVVINYDVVPGAATPEAGDVRSI